jgi:hypothetical protein
MTSKLGANPTTVIYNASAVKIYSATSSLVRFEEKNSSALKNAIAHYNAGVVNSKVGGLAPDHSGHWYQENLAFPIWQ